MVPVSNLSVKYLRERFVSVVGMLNSIMNNINQLSDVYEALLGLSVRIENINLRLFILVIKLF